MARKILIALDGAHLNLKELPAIEHADLSGEDEVLLLGVLLHREVVRVPSSVIPEAAQEESKMLEATKDLHLLGEDLRHDRGCAVTTHVVIGDPVVQAVAFARQNKVDGILVGMKEPGGLGRLFSKGMAKRIADKTHMPVKALEEPTRS